MSTRPAKIFLHEKFNTDNKIDTATLSDGLKAKLNKFNETKAKVNSIENFGERIAGYKKLDVLSNTLQEDIEDEVKALQAQADESEAAAETERQRLAGVQTAEAAETERLRLLEEEKNKKKKGGGGWGWVLGGFLIAGAAFVGIQLSKDGKKK